MSICAGVGWFSKEQVGECGSGDIYSGYGWGKTQVGSYSNGEIYAGYGWGKTQVGSYSGSENSPAATALLLLLNNK